MSDQPQSPLERAISALKKESFSGGIQEGLDRAIEICKLFLPTDETKGEPEEKQKWEVITAISNDFEYIKAYCLAGYEPFAVDQGIIYFKRPCAKEEKVG